MFLYRLGSVYRRGTVTHVRTALNTKFNKNHFSLFELIHAHRRTDCEHKSVRIYANSLKIQLLVSGSNFFSLKFTRSEGGGGGGGARRKKNSLLNVIRLPRGGCIYFIGGWAGSFSFKILSKFGTEEENVFTSKWKQSSRITKSWKSTVHIPGMREVCFGVFLFCFEGCLWHTVLNVDLCGTCVSL